MDIKVEVAINAPKEKVWEIISDIEGSVDIISGIQKIEVLEKPAEDLVGLKWEETRLMFGKSATEIMWITEAEENKYYQTRAERPGVVYISKLSLAEKDGQTHLTMSFLAEISSFGQRILSGLMGIFFNKATRDAVKQDLVDIKTASEKK